jgi:hypothetical protein
VTTAQLFAEAFATLWTLRDVLLLWIVAGSAVVSVCGLGAVAGGVWVWQAVRGAWAPAGGPEGGSGLPGDLRAAPEPAETLSGPRVPSWARGDADDRTEIEEAA